MKKTTISLTLVLATALFTMGAKWADKPIDSLATIAGKWSGSGTSASGYGYTISYVFKEDGSIDFSVIGSRFSDKGERPPGTLRVNGGKLEWTNRKGLLWTATLYEGKKGKRMLKGSREDGSSWKVKEKK